MVCRCMFVSGVYMFPYVLYKGLKVCGLFDFTPFNWHVQSLVLKKYYECHESQYLPNI